MITRKQNEERIVQLLEQGKTSKEIMREAHVSPNLISAIRKKLEGDQGHPSIRIQAYEMYLGGKRPIDVAISLQIDNVEAIRYWKEYLQLKGEDTLLKIRNELEDDFTPFVKYYNVMKKNNYWLSDLERALEIISKTDRAVIFLEETEDEKRKCQEEVDHLQEDVKNLENEKLIKKHEIDSMAMIVRFLSISIRSLVEEKRYIEEALTQLYNTASYSKTVIAPSNSNFNFFPSRK
jgi:hypothetical protein